MLLYRLKIILILNSMLFSKDVWQVSVIYETKRWLKRAKEREREREKEKEILIWKCRYVVEHFSDWGGDILIEFEGHCNTSI